MSLLDLPYELLISISSYLTAKDVLHLSVACKDLLEVKLHDRLWKNLCLTDYGVDLHLGERISARNVYMKLLHRYGSLIGLWQATVKHYGGLVKIQYENGHIVGDELHAPYYSTDTDALKRIRLFSIGFEESEDDVTVLNGEDREAKISFLKDGVFMIQRLDVETPPLRAGSQEQLFRKWLVGEGYGPRCPHYDRHPDDLLCKFLILAKSQMVCCFKRLQWPSANRGVPVEPGLFRSDYGDHGPELIMLRYDTDEAIAKAIKITGDPNVPAGKVTFYANLDKPFSQLTWEDQETVEKLREVKAQPVPFWENQHLDLPPQVFRVPADIMDEFEEGMPEVSIARYQGWCQLADHGYKNAKFSKGHWVVFNNDTFAFIFLEIFSISVFNRVQNNLLP